MQRNTC